MGREEITKEMGAKRRLEVGEATERGGATGEELRGREAKKKA